MRSCRYLKGWTMKSYLVAIVLTIFATASNANPAAGVAGMVISIFLVIVFIAFVLSFFIARWFFPANLKRWAALPVLIFWGLLFEITIARPNRQSAAEAKIRVAASLQCENDYARFKDILPIKMFPVDGVLDEAASFDEGVIYQLFSERKLKYIEFKVQNFSLYSESLTPRISHGWNVDRPVGSYVRLELGKHGDENCTVNKAYRLAPFLPDTCLKMSYPLASKAKFAITHQTTGDNPRDKQSSWLLIDKQQGITLAKLGTSDPPNFARVAGIRASRPNHPKFSDCRAPHAMLVDRLIGMDQSAEGHPQLLSEVDSVSTLPINGLVPARYVNAVADAASTDKEWSDSVDEAKESGWGAYKEKLIDWKNRTLIKLQLTEKSDAANTWVAHAGGDGFWSYSTRQAWGSYSQNILIHYSSDGAFRWSVGIKTPKSSNSNATADMWPKCISVDKNFVQVHSVCNGDFGVTWKVNRKDLPQNTAKKP
jgi:hypothetical protein